MKRADIIANLGSPSELTEEATEKFLREFLSDPLVIPLPFPFRNLLAYRISKKRKSIYLSALKETLVDGRSSILAYTERLAKKVEQWTSRKTYAAYRYGENNLEDVIKRAKADGAESFVVIPAYPQNAKPTTESIKVVIDKLQKKLGIKISFLQSYCDHPLYIEALVKSILDSQSEQREDGNLDSLIMSFHSVPESMREPYARECEITARLVAEKLGDRNILLGWQSKTGKGKWLEPSTEMLAKKIARRGIKNITLICPGFAVDCTETLIEIGKELKETFLQNGGEQFTYIPCLNDSEQQVELFAKLFEETI